MDGLPHNLYRAEGVRALDGTAMDEFGLGDGVLMDRAGRAAFAELRRRWPEAVRIGVLCGGGNNAGDGYVVAQLALEAGLAPRILQVGDRDRLKGDALAAAAAAETAGVPASPFPGTDLDGFDLLVDALLGTGLSGEVEGRWREAIESANGAPAPVFALDIPSGLAADTGAVLGAAVRAAATITFIGLKQGLFTAAGPERCGEVVFAGLDVPAGVYDRVAATAERLDLEWERAVLAPRERDAHKGAFGHVLVIGGDAGLAGAARMAGEAAARTGAGLVSVATRAVHAPALAAARPELMARGCETPAELVPLLARASVVAVGPGLGQGAWGRAMLGRVLESDRPLVIDADALNLLATDPAHRDDWVLTPHPGEAARLLRVECGTVQADRFAAAAAVREAFGGVCVLKGAGTVVAGPGLPAVCTVGNPGMASGGMGDVLTGTIAGLLAQGLSPERAARLGVCLHATAADRAAAADGERGLLATDLLPYLRHLVNPA